MRFYKCPVCGKIVTMIEEKPIPTMCCGKPMEEIVPGTVEASEEKHIPVVEINQKNITVKIGEVEHPMIPEHYIQWIAIETKEGFQLKYLTPDDSPKAEFALSNGDEFVSAYEYCNIHGLWKK